MYRDEIYSLYVVGWNFFLLLHNCSAWPCLGPAEQDLKRINLISVYTFHKYQFAIDRTFRKQILAIDANWPSFLVRMHCPLTKRWWRDKKAIPTCHRRINFSSGPRLFKVCPTEIQENPWARLSESRTRARVTQPSPCILLHICTWM